MMKILVGYDGSESGDAALNDLQRAGLPHDAEALIISVADVLTVSPANYEIVGQALTSRRVTSGIIHAQAQTAQALKDAKVFTARARDRVRSHFPEWDVHSEELAGQPSWELIKKADEWKPDLLVVGSHGRSAIGRFILGSVSKKVVTDSHRSVRVTRGAVEEHDSKPPRVLIGVDGSSEAEHAVRAVGRRTWPNGTEVRIITADDGTSPASIARAFPAESAMNHNEESAVAAQRMVAWAENELNVIGLDVSVAAETGEPRRVLVAEAQKWNADSIFVGSRRFSGAFERFWLGSVATALVTKAHCSVEVVRGATG